MLSHAYTGRSRVIYCHLRDIGGYRSMVGYICYRGKRTMGNVNGDPFCCALLAGGNQTESKGRLGLNVLASGVLDCAAQYGPVKCRPELYQR